MMRNNGLNVLVLTKRQYTNKDLIDDRFGRIWELPAGLAAKGHRITGLCLSYKKRSEGVFHVDGMIWESINAGPLKIAGLRRFCRRARQLAQDADVIWASSDSIYGIIGYYLARCLRIPFVFDLLDNYEYFLLAR
ncbi:MAG: group 1 glycosyl transferase, partial [bacterium]|nr:group 1 glycosyl transferase [bacterium]